LTDKNVRRKTGYTRASRTVPASSSQADESVVIVDELDREERVVEREEERGVERAVEGEMERVERGGERDECGR
jgi:hypothetical protein